MSTVRVPRDPVARLLAAAALALAAFAAINSAGASQAKSAKHAPAKKHTTAKKAPSKLPAISTVPKKYGLLRLNSKKRFPSAAIPTVAAAKSASTLAGKSLDDLTSGCTPETVDLGTYCLDASLYQVPNNEIGRNDFAYASRACADQGGWLPSASMLMGAAAHVKLASTIDDNMTTASVDVDPTDGLKDTREMSSTLYTTAAGSSAAGSEGITPGSKGNPKQSEPDPTPVPPDPTPETTQYMTVYDNGNLGGLAGGEPVGKAERFRCAYDKAQGANATGTDSRSSATARAGGGR